MRMVRKGGITPYSQGERPNPMIQLNIDTLDTLNFTHLVDYIHSRRPLSRHTPLAFQGKCPSIPEVFKRPEGLFDLLPNLTVRNSEVRRNAEVLRRGGPPPRPTPPWNNAITSNPVLVSLNLTATTLPVFRSLTTQNQ